MQTIFTIKPCSPMATDVSNMIEALDFYLSDLYPAESNHLDSRQTLSETNCKLLGAYRDNELMGIGAAKKFENYGELKRFYVPEAFRGMGVAELIIAALEYWLSENGIYQSCLETGISQYAALKFYKKLGYRKIGPFGPYKEDPLSLFMGKNLSSTELIAREGDMPFYLVAFSSQLITLSSKYNEVGNEMDRLAREQDGFIGSNSVRNEEGFGFTASYWQNMEAISAWRKHPRHQEAQRLGRTEFYKSFRTSIARVEALSI